MNMNQENKQNNDKKDNDLANNNNIISEDNINAEKQQNNDNQDNDLANDNNIISEDNINAEKQQNYLDENYTFGWSKYSEITNGRFAMLGFIAIILIELISKQSFLNWSGLIH